MLKLSHHVVPYSQNCQWLLVLLKLQSPGGLHGQAAFSSALFPSATPDSLCSSQAGLLLLEKTPPPQGLLVVPAGPLAWTALCQKAMGLPLPL